MTSTPVPYSVKLALRGLLLGAVVAAPAVMAAESTAASPLPGLATPAAPLSTLPKFYVKAFRLEGNALFGTELEALLQPYTQREVSAEELQEVRHKISQYYVERGYINSGAIIPDQEISDGIIVLRIVEGRLTEVSVSGSKHLSESYLQERVRPRADEPLNTESLQERLQILQQGPLVKRFNAELGPGLRPGEAVLRFEVEEKKPYEVSAEFNNHRSPNVGAYRLTLEGKHNSVSGRGDTLYARYGLTRGLSDYALEYSLPVNYRDTTVTARLERSDSEVVSEPFQALDVKSQAQTYSVGVRHPLIRTYTKDFHYKVLELGLNLEKRSSETFLLDEPYSFSPGVQDGESTISALRFNQNWLDRSRERVLAFYSSFGIGLHAMGSTRNDGLDAQGNPAIEPDSRFLTWVGQFRWVQRMPTVYGIKNSQLWLRADLQWSNKDLLPLEKFAVGGVNTVRGYRENQLTRDRGAVLSAEWQIPLNSDATWILAPFIDFGGGWNVKLNTPQPKTLSSVGLGLLWSPKPFLHAELYWGKALRDVSEPVDEDLQDHGIHFSLKAQY